jgi:DNA-binding transcriptional ArsR family regulator
LVRGIEPGETDLREWARYFHALKDILRLRILLTLAQRGEVTVTELSRLLRVSQPLVSFHLRPLRTLDLVAMRRAGRAVYYSINRQEIERRHQEFLDLLAHAMDVDS